MNESMNTLLTRRSIRKYKTDQITDEELKQILEAGTYAPSAKNEQGSLMIAVQNKALIAQLSEMNRKIWQKDIDPFYGAPTVVIVFGNKEHGQNGWSDACLVMGNLMNAARAIGVASCWINRAKEMFETPEGKALMKEWGVPDNMMGVGNCILGYAERPNPKALPRKDGWFKIIT